GTEVFFGAGELIAAAGERRSDGARELILTQPADPEAAEALLERLGQVPLPPYITAPLADPERYQTIYARAAGSAAAPTAGLHFTPALFQALAARGAQCAFITLDVGIATFQPVRAPEIEAHVMHADRYVVPEATAAAVAGCRGRVIVVGTSTAR